MVRSYWVHPNALDSKPLGEDPDAPALEVVPKARLTELESALRTEFESAQSDHHHGGCNPATREPDYCECGLSERRARLRAVLDGIEGAA